MNYKELICLQPTKEQVLTTKKKGCYMKGKKRFGRVSCSPEDLPEAMNDREKWQEKVRDIRASTTTWWNEKNFKNELKSFE